MQWKQDPDPNEGAAAGDVPAQRADPPRPEGSRVVDGQFILADLVDEDWTTRPGLAGLRFAVVACLATLFHIPSRQKRRALLERAAAMAEPGGMVVISVWQFLHRERFQRRIVPWSTAGLSETEVEEGDLLLDWRAGGHGLRYVHHYAVGELDEDISGIGLRIVEDYRSDGDTGDLSRYLVLRRDSSPEDRGCGSSMPMTE